MKTEQIYTFVVREKFGRFQEGETFQAAVRTFVHDMVEKQDFIMEDGFQMKGVACKYTQFVEINTI